MSAIPPPHYVRLRRYNLSIFVHCDVHNDTVQAIKERYGKLTGHIFYNARLYLGQQSLDDFLTLYGCGIEAEGAELVVVHSKGAKGDGTSEHIWETVEEAMAAPQGDSLNSPEVTAEGTAKLDSMEAAATSNEVGNQQQQQAADARGGTGAELNVGFVGV
ncbi:uncharacterized protein TEOVI_000671200 [Trypanosoma equiperdum]|uniref:Ubiquitin-like domain-containing protein n=3 Tax=Trypanozoon TaxID=39700 RepID=Q585Z0_TRYB2|nr:hypothetical protein, conserved [Trypanosoma brucei gambiense DAL972]XP_845510.1 hypothetical protein, conserved [Trypanosoma brucei brucei TREU927]AAX80770.1 hypothetical protein, conserved [Trypanosoma brucei]SCU68125.1 hypothetical protein, conserved [Trypanosoma equiperdum]AAZ11951.1 hypothetical protein, conserved [Trypanosoma brucei brucei TREU927]CBH11892.1 hypothetical protein, conserved [Trypanosoma brucei gambiense DAL972]|eukprot:XP_011774177.1 hypothetical protein, conserved [Trypanosoma brucei gambiense DAL972]